MKLLIKKVRDIAPESDAWMKVGEKWQKVGEATKKTSNEGKVYLEVDFVLPDAPQTVTLPYIQQNQNLPRSSNLPIESTYVASTEPNFDQNRDPKEMEIDNQALKEAEDRASAQIEKLAEDRKAELEYDNFGKIK